MDSINLAARASSFATYLPSVQPHSAKRIANDNGITRDGGLPASLKATDFNYLDSSNRFWSYPNCLATAGHFKDMTSDNMITSRNPVQSFVLGDSGGFQIGHGTLPEVSGWLQHANDVGEIIRRWRSSDAKKKILRFLELQCSMGLSIDVPLWARGLKHSPFRKLSVEQLTELSVENLRFITENRGRYGDCDMLSVLQGETEPDEDAWFEAVRHYPLEGWSLAGHVGQMGGIYRVLRRMLLLRDAKLLEAPHNTVHILRLSRVRWAPVVTAIQNAVRKHVGNQQFKMTMDSSSPYKIGGVVAKYAALNEFGRDIKTWAIKHFDVPTGWAVANAKRPIPLNQHHLDYLPAPMDSPIASLLTAQDINPKTGDFAVRTLDTFADEVIINHNVFTYVMATIKANEAVRDGNAPQAMMDACGMIDEMFAIDDWRSALKKAAPALAAVVGDSQPDLGDDRVH